MRDRFTKIILLILMPVQTLMSLPAWAKEPDPLTGATLFYIERSRDTDKVMYILNRDKSGRIFTKDPIKVFWYRDSKGKSTESLSKIQETLAYGARIISHNSHVISFHLAAYPDQVFNIELSGNLPYKVYTKIGNQNLIVSKIYIEFSKRTYWIPAIDRVDLIGYVAKNREPKTCSFYPNK